MHLRARWSIAPLGCLLGAAIMPVVAQTRAKNGEWPTYGGDLGSTRYAGLDQINAGNFGQLEIAWRFKADALGPRPEYQYESTPLMVHGVLFSTAGSRRAVVALDAATGEMLWMHSENEGTRGVAAPRQVSGRGLAYWTDGKEERILYVTPGYRLFALDARTGALVRSFGQKGFVDLKLDDDQEVDPETPDNVRNHPALKGLNIPHTGRPGLIGTLATKTLVIAGEGGYFTLPSGARGAMLRAYDKATGKEVGAVYMPAPQSGSPMTYMLNGKQYIVIAISGGNYSGELLAFRLPG
jgi:glucose dehydrogenase